MVDSNETIMYENGRDAGYTEGYEDALIDVAKVIGDTCPSCLFEKDCKAYSDEDCIKRIIECLKQLIG